MSVAQLASDTIYFDSQIDCESISDLWIVKQFIFSACEFGPQDLFTQAANRVTKEAITL